MSGPWTGQNSNIIKGDEHSQRCSCLLSIHSLCKEPVKPGQLFLNQWPSLAAWGSVGTSSASLTPSRRGRRRQETRLKSLSYCCYKLEGPKVCSSSGCRRGSGFSHGCKSICSSVGRSEGFGDKHHRMRSWQSGKEEGTREEINKELQFWNPFRLHDALYTITSVSEWQGFTVRHRIHHL